MKPKTIVLLSTFLSLASLSAGEKPAENAVAKQFRQHLQKADQNRDGSVTKAELVQAITNETKADPATVDQIVSTIMKDLDVDQDEKLSASEIDAGAIKAGEHAVADANVKRAQRVMDALIKYKKQHDDTLPATLEELSNLNLLPTVALQCILVDGNEQPWGYEPGKMSAADP